MCAEAHGWWVETLGGWDIQCSCVSLSEAMGEGAVGEGAMREGVPVFSHHLMPQLGTQSLREQKSVNKISNWCKDWFLGICQCGLELFIIR